MGLVFRILSALVLLVSACAPARSAEDAVEGDEEPPNTPGDAKVRLVARAVDGGERRVKLTAPAKRYEKGALFYALDEQPAKMGEGEGVGARPRIGVAQVVDAEAMLVKWLCEPPEGAMKALSGAGLAVEPLRPAVRARVGKCWGAYKAQEVEAWDKRSPSAIYLPLNLGRRDGVRAWDYYEVLDKPVVGADNQTVLEFKRIGLCVIQPVGLTERGSVCRLDSKAWPAFDREDWARDGVVWLAQEAPPPKPSDRAPSPRAAGAESLLKRP